jgi:hypothetical protein
LAIVVTTVSSVAPEASTQSFCLLNTLLKLGVPRRNKDG